MSDFALDISRDFEIFDGLEPLELIQAGSGRLQIVRSCLSFPVTSRDAVATNGSYTLSDVKFNFPAAETLGFEPLVGDFVRDNDGALWSIGLVELLTLKTRRQLWGKKVNLHPQLSKPLKVLKPINKKDDSGAAFTEWRLVKTVTGYVEELSSMFEVEEGRKVLKVSHRIYFVDTFPVQSGFRIEDEFGKTFNVSRVTGKDKLGAAMVLDCEGSRSPVSN